MYLKELNIIHFKNINTSQLFFSKKINCFTGNNGTGKTNIIDAIYYLSMGKSAFNLTDNQCIKHETDFFMLDGNYEINDERYEKVVCSYKPSSGKVIKRNDKEYAKLSEHIGLFPIVMVSPADTCLINESADERRRYMNAFLSQIDKEYLGTLVRYNGLLIQRNRLLKELQNTHSLEILDIINMQMDELASIIYKKRTEFIEKITPVVEYYYSILSDEHEKVSLSYNSDLSKASLSELLANSFEKDKINGFTTVGIHRDDIKMKIKDYPIRKYGSQGQQKSFLIALKLAQFDIITAIKNFKPILLLDDIFDKLDLQRVSNLIALVSQDKFGQIFITDSNKVRLDGLLKKLTQTYTLFTVDNGEINIQ
ncbi:MAG TPA: DNA replication and repair protein RecF [Candidatus Avirikenella pullistercoris]|nr:DNA replication and repair protein RecF [Candidatus Avirikenella pullistercoris]